MSYNAYVMFLSQVASQKKARVIYQDQPVSIEKGEQKNHWVLSTPIFVGEHEIPPAVQECISSAGTFKWEKDGAYLKADSVHHVVFLVQEVHCTMTYLPFRQLITEFSDLAAEWREILEDLSGRDYSII